MRELHKKQEKKRQCIDFQPLTLVALRLIFVAGWLAGHRPTSRTKILFSGIVLNDTGVEKITATLLSGRHFYNATDARKGGIIYDVAIQKKNNSKSITNILDIDQNGL